MVKVKSMNEPMYAKLQKQLTIAGELIRARQEEKQGLLDEFDEEAKRYFFGKISQRALQMSVRKTNKELARLNKAIRVTISSVKKTGDRASTLAAAQAPIAFKATMTGISIPGKKRVAKRKVKKKVIKRAAPKKKAVKNKAAKKKVVKKKVVKKKASKKKKRR